MMQEHRNLEFKESITNTFLKTVSAFANFCTGKILFGVDDEGKEKGVSNPQQACLDIENKINDSIQPKPDFSFEINQRTKVVTLTVFEGDFKPYLYKGKAYRRADTASIEVDRVELGRLVLEGSNQYYDQLMANKQDLHFCALEARLKSELGIEKINMEILKTLDLYSDKTGYNNAAALLADENDMPGIDVARFGSTEDEIRERIFVHHKSVLQQMDEVMAVFRRNYVVEVIEGAERREKQLVPEKAFREAVANALVHRTWDVGADIRICMYEGRIEILSPGGLPFGIEEKEYLRGQVSVLRNPVLGGVFFRLRYIEKFGTGIKRIQRAYRDSQVKPEFEIFSNSIKIVLPALSMCHNLTTDEHLLYGFFQGGRILSRSELEVMSGFNKDKTGRILKSLSEKKVIEVYGRGRGTKYGIKS